MTLQTQQAQELAGAKSRQHALNEPFQRAFQEALRAALNAIPPDRARDFGALLRLLLKEEDPAERNAIVQTMAEVLVPELTKIPVDEVTSADEAEASEKVDGWYRKVGKTIKSQRQLANLTQEELAKKAGIPQSHVSRLETGKHAPSYVTIEKIAKALGLRPGDIDPGCEP